MDSRRASSRDSIRLRLDYEGSPFIDADGNLLTDGFVRIEFTTSQSEYIEIPYGNRDGTNLDPDPASGNGFIKSEEYTVPEYKAENPKKPTKTVGLKKGAKMYLNIDGEEVLVAVANDDGMFEYVGG